MGSSTLPKMHDQATSLDGCERVHPGAFGCPAEPVHDSRRASRRGAARNHGNPGRGSPAKRRCPRLHRVVGFATEHRVDDQALKTGVPRATRLGCVGVDLRGREGDLAGVAQHRLPERLLLTRLGQCGRVLLDDVDDRAHQVEGLAQGDRAGQLARGGAEDVGGDGCLVAAVAQPGDERRDARLGDQADPGPVLRRERAVPLVRRLHPPRRGRRELTGGPLDPLQGGGRRADASGRHTGSLFVCRPQPAVVVAGWRASRRGAGGGGSAGVVAPGVLRLVAQ